MATAELSVVPIGSPDPSVSHVVAEIHRRLARQQRVRYRLHAMGTELEGETTDILALVAELHRVPFELGYPRVYTVLKLDERRDRPQQTLEDKVRAVERELRAVEREVPATEREVSATEREVSAVEREPAGD